MWWEKTRVLFGKLNDGAYVLVKPSKFKQNCKETIEGPNIIYYYIESSPIFKYSVIHFEISCRYFAYMVLYPLKVVEEFNFRFTLAFIAFVQPVTPDETSVTTRSGQIMISMIKSFRFVEEFVNALLLISLASRWIWMNLLRSQCCEFCTWVIIWIHVQKCSKEVMCMPRYHR